MNKAELSLFISRIQGICAEMGVILQHSAISPNIRDRLDFSCAIFDADGRLTAQAAHIPVHLGSMAYAMQDLVARIVHYCHALGDIGGVVDSAVSIDAEARTARDTLRLERAVQHVVSARGPRRPFWKKVAALERPSW